MSSGLYFVLKPVKIGKELVFGGGGGLPKTSIYLAHIFSILKNCPSGFINV